MTTKGRERQQKKPAESHKLGFNVSLIKAQLTNFSKVYTLHYPQSNPNYEDFGANAPSNRYSASTADQLFVIIPFLGYHCPNHVW